MEIGVVTPHTKCTILDGILIFLSSFFTYTICFKSFFIRWEGYLTASPPWINQSLSNKKSFNLCAKLRKIPDIEGYIGRFFYRLMRKKVV
jgi:hypothetical protein